MNEISNVLIDLLKKNEELYSHSKEVSTLAFQFGIYMGLGYRDVQLLKVGGFLHDIGKVIIPEEVLYKPSRLTDDEFALIKEHPNRGYHLLMETEYRFSKEIYEIVLEHHERIDGKGYPNALKEQEISTLAQIVSLCDVYSAITMKRSYKESKNHEFAIQEIKKGIGTQFNSFFGQSFVQFLEQQKYAEIQKLNANKISV